ncbi:hypothetical protein J4Q44_G00109610 [Coregonus suidteri]|uniref:Uncharacterized protein n=1 Tax=Coregonus suidteri TaxID=861788 RepID=A0AAN8LT23_9TELE
MMGSSSQRVQPSFTVDPLVQMPRQGGTVIGSMVTTDAVGFSKPACLAHHPSTPHPPPQTQALQYNRAYFTYDLRGHDLSDPDPRPSWSPSKGLLLNGRNVGVHPQSAEEGSLRNHIVYSRAENKTFSTERSSGGSSNSISAAAQDTPAKQGFTYYTRSPGGLRSPTSGPGTIWELPVGGVSLSPQSENSVCLGLAVPKPLYGHPSPCCPELACTGEQRHILEQRGGVHRIHPHLNVYEGWRYSPSPHHQHHPRSLQLEHRVETEGLSDRLPLKDVKDHQHHHHRGSPNRAASAQRFPAFMEPTYSSGYPCSPARGILGPSSSRLGPSFICDSSSSQLSSSPYGADQCQRLQIPSKLSTDHSLVSSHHPSHPSSHPSHPPTNEPMTPSHHGVPVMSQVYQGRSPPNVAKYSQLPATLPMFSYHPQEGAEGGKHRDWEDVVPTGSEQPLPPPPTQTGRHLTSHLPTTPTPPHYLVAQSVYRTDVPMSAHMAPSSHQYLRSFDQPSCHQMYRMPLNAAGQMRTPITSPERPCAPPPSPPSSLQQTERPLDYSLPQYRPPVTSPQVSSPRRHHLSQGHTDSTLTVSTTLSLADYGHHNHPTNHHHSNNHATAAKCTAAANYGNHNHNHHITTANHHITTPNHHNTTSTAKCQGVTGSPVVRIRGSPVPRSNGHGDMVTTATGTLKRCVSDSDRPINVDSPSPKHTQDNGDDVIDVELYQKRQKMKPEPPQRIKTEEMETQQDPEREVEVKTDDDMETKVVKDEEMVAETANTKLNLQNIPPQCLKLTTYKFVLPDNMLRGIPPSPHSTEVPESPTDPAAVAESCHRPPALSDSLSSSRPARQHFLELHLSLCNLVSSCVSHTPATELQTWLSQLDIYPTSTTSPPPKAQKVTSLLGSGARAVCLRGPETQAALQKVLQRLGQYVAQQQCPFPHVIRAGAVFVPMLVVKALLFPQVQGAYIDQVLQVQLSWTGSTFDWS